MFNDLNYTQTAFENIRKVMTEQENNLKAGGDEFNAAYLKKYKPLIKSL